eukprot:scaffold20461_cov117-Cylindrotheca_fusiformis.AAC.4
MRSVILIFLLLSFLFANGHIFGQKGRNTNPSQRSVKVKNESGRKIDVFWVNNLKRGVPETFVSQSEDGDGYSYGADAGILSYVGHMFEIREMPGKKSGKCLEETCWKGRFVVNDEKEQVGKNFVMTHTDSHKRAEEKARKLLEECQEKAKSDELSAFDTVDFIADCMKEKSDQELAKQEEEVQFQAQVRTELAEQLIPYACGDVNFTETEESLNTTWTYQATQHTVRVYHRQISSGIVAIRDFLTNDECQAMVQAEKKGTIGFNKKSSPKLQRLVAKLYAYSAKLLEWEALQSEWTSLLGKDTALFYAHKDSKGLKLPEKQCTATDVENDDTSSCKMPGQAPVPAETTGFHIPHDEESDGGPVATAFLFCEKPAQLGGLHFPYAGVHIEPRPGMLVMAVHRSLDGEEYDGFVQDYHFCPNHQLYTHSFYPSKVES